MSVIVTNAKNRISYATVQSLGLKGIDVIAADSSRTAMTFYSKYSHNHFIYPSPYSAPQEFINEIVMQAQQRKCNVIIPVYEETYLFSKYRKLIPDNINMVLPSYENILQVHNKDRLYEIASTIGIRVPVSYRLSEIEQNPKLLDSLIFPVLIKPCQGGAAWGVKKIKTPLELQTAIINHELPASMSASQFVVQEFITGDVVCCAMLFNKGEFRAVHCYRQIRETPISGGAATYRESIWHNQVIDNMRNLLSYLKWHGICQADFIVDKNSGIAYLIDVNPRLYGSLLLSIKSGVDFPYLIYQMAIKGDVDPVGTFDTGIRTRWIFGDIKNFCENLLMVNQHKHSISEYLRTGKIEYYDELNSEDIKPFFMWIFDYVVKSLRQKHDVPNGIWE